MDHPMAQGFEYIFENSIDINFALLFLSTLKSPLCLNINKTAQTHKHIKLTKTWVVGMAQW
jgi:hypothetical protein